MFFSVVIPTYNRASTVVHAVESVIAQDFKDFEIIIIDDGSTDETEYLIKSRFSSFLNIQYFLQKNSERGAARNKGIELANGEYVTFLDSDDLFLSQHLKTAYQVIHEQQKPELVHLAYQIITPNGKILKVINHLGNINQKLIKGNPLSCIGVFVQRSIMKANLFNENRVIAGLEDWEAWLRLGAQFKFIASEEITASIVQHNDRSVMKINLYEVRHKIKYFMECVISNSSNQVAYRNKFNKIEASLCTYFALHLAMGNSSPSTIFRLLVRGILLDPAEILRKRLFVTLKILIGL